MLSLIHQNFRHILRTKLLFFLVVFSFLIHYLGVKLVHSATVYFNGVMAIIDAKDALFISLVFQLFTAGFISAVYGIWMVPYAHEGGRGPLTFTLPVSKWQFPVVYFFCMFLLLLIEHVIMLASFGLNFGWEVFRQPTFPWLALAVCVAIETLAFETLMFALSLLSMLFGQVIAFFLGTLVLFLLQFGGVIFRVNWGPYLGSPSSFFIWAQRLYWTLPRFGELVVDLRREFLKPAWQNSNLSHWLVWLLILVVLFRLRLRYPANARTSE